jgi:hypothetical protein
MGSRAGKWRGKKVAHLLDPGPFLNSHVPMLPGSLPVQGQGPPIAVDRRCHHGHHSGMTRSRILYRVSLRDTLAL